MWNGKGQGYWVTGGCVKWYVQLWVAGETGAYPTRHRAQGRVHPEQVWSTPTAHLESPTNLWEEAGAPRKITYRQRENRQRENVQTQYRKAPVSLQSPFCSEAKVSCILGWINYVGKKKTLKEFTKLFNMCGIHWLSLTARKRSLVPSNCTYSGI